MGQLGDERALFWDWFEKNAGQLWTSIAEATSPEELEPALIQFIEALHRYDDRLSILIGANIDGIHEVIVTAEGSADAFQSVFELIRCAPEAPGWKFIPLKPRFGEVDLIDTVQHQGCELRLEDVRFAMADGDELLSLAIIVDDFTEETGPIYEFIAINMIESLIGEYDLATKIGGIELFTRDKFRQIAGHDGYPLAEFIEAIPPSLPH